MYFKELIKIDIYNFNFLIMSKKNLNFCNVS